MSGLPIGVRAALTGYGLTWMLAAPGLRMNRRLAEGWDQRTLSSGPPPRADLWVQAASGGEAYLAWELLRRLPEHCAARQDVLATTFTSQGLGVLERASENLPEGVSLRSRYFPFDTPRRMRRALAAVAPKAVALLETELWPGILAACREQNVPALVLNGRMTEKSLKGYLRAPWFWRALSPSRVLAVSDADAGRFQTLFPAARVDVAPNIKFDRLDFAPRPPDEKLAALLPDPAEAPFIVLGSVRKEEEADVLQIILGLRQRLPKAVIGLFPRHMQRVDAWSKLLVKAGVPLLRRSADEKAQPGALVLWDKFGELMAAYSLAQACFLGGSLADLGGQNFLEPLAFGLRPVTGPSWSNFTWVGEEAFTSGLVHKEEDWRGVLDELADSAANPPDRDLVRAAAGVYAAARRGGAAASCQAVAECLDCG